MPEETIPRRLMVLQVACAVAFFIVVGRFYMLQVAEGITWTKVADAPMFDPRLSFDEVMMQSLQ